MLAVDVGSVQLLFSETNVSWNLFKISFPGHPLRLRTRRHLGIGLLTTPIGLSVIPIKVKYKI